MKEHSGSRKQAQGWLSGYMFDDHAPVKAEQKAKPVDDGGLQHAKWSLEQNRGNPELETYWKNQIEKIKGE